ncbi:MAG: hypothetical protein II399_08075 [Lachnospiraceae bacterium]|nr:hypothetical protein [Lachnospiraceae bacterium]
MNIQSFNKFVKVRNSYWIDQPGESLCQATANKRGINYHGLNVTRPADVRPVLILNYGFPEGVKEGYTVELFGKKWILVDDFYPVLMCKTPLCDMRFSNTGNTYATSDVKKYLEDWLTKQKKTL